MIFITIYVTVGALQFFVLNYGLNNNNTSNIKYLN